MKPLEILGWTVLAGTASLLVYAIYTSSKGAPAQVPAQPATPVPGTLPGANLPGTTPTNPPDCPSTNARILLVGDSLVGDTPTVGIRARMAQLAAGCSTPFVAKGVVGSHCTEWAQDSWIKTQLDLARPTAVILSMGTNDFKRNDPANVMAGIKSLAKKIRDSGATLLWISPPTMPFADSIGVRAMWLAEVGTLHTFHAENMTIPRGGDNIHPTMAGYKMFGEAVWYWAADILNAEAPIA
jgi:lysophospholipase L1-like esterase